MEQSQARGAGLTEVNIVEPYAHLVGLPDRDAGVELLRKIEFCARVSHATEDAQTGDSWDRFIRAVVLQHGDWSVVEHATATVDFLVDRGISHELVRHRLMSYTQSSTRFINYAKKMPPSFIMPDFSACSYRAETESIWRAQIEKAEGAYRDLLLRGCAPQIARSVFPNALSTRVLVTANLRSWRHVLIMRTTKEAHPQMRQVMIPLLAEFQQRIPILFEDITPMERQAGAISKGR
jgi:thymidylate synthase (FAD)